MLDCAAVQTNLLPKMAAEGELHVDSARFRVLPQAGTPAPRGCDSVFIGRRPRHPDLFVDQFNELADEADTVDGGLAADE
jgi:hypothetical protein